jgi:hypothetical protein
MGHVPLDYTWFCINCKKKTSPWTFKAAFKVLYNTIAISIGGGVGTAIKGQGNALFDSPGFDLLGVINILNDWCDLLEDYLPVATIDDMRALVNVGFQKDMMTTMSSITSLFEVP